MPTMHRTITQGEITNVMYLVFLLNKRGRDMETLRFAQGTPQWRVLERAVRQYGDHLRIEPRRKTVTTLQGNTETGWLVYGRAHGGGDVGVVFASRLEAQATIDALTIA